MAACCGPDTDVAPHYKCKRKIISCSVSTDIHSLSISKYTNLCNVTPFYIIHDMLTVRSGVQMHGEHSKIEEWDRIGVYGEWRVQTVDPTVYRS